MKHNFMTKMVSALLAVVLSTAAFSVTAFASGGEESTESVAEQETVGDVSDLLSALAGSQVTVSVTEDGIQFSSGENDSGQTGTVTTGGGNLNVRTGAGMDYTAFAQLGDLLAGLVVAGVDKIRGFSAALGDELAKPQHIRTHHKLNKFLFCRCQHKRIPSLFPRLV